MFDYSIDLIGGNVISGTAEDWELDKVAAAWIHPGSDKFVKFQDISDFVIIDATQIQCICKHKNNGEPHSGF